MTPNTLLVVEVAEGDCDAFPMGVPLARNDITRSDDWGQRHKRTSHQRRERQMEKKKNPNKRKATSAFKSKR